jgi:hypothetical protein
LVRACAPVPLKRTIEQHVAGIAQQPLGCALSSSEKSRARRSRGAAASLRRCASTVAVSASGFGRLTRMFVGFAATAPHRGNLDARGLRFVAALSR